MSGHPQGFLAALKWAFVLSSGRRAIAMTFSLVLAAMLGPREFGLVAMAIVYIAFFRLFLEQGFVTALIQRRDLDPEHLDSAFWMSLAWGLALNALAVALSWWWAAANGTDDLAPIIWALSPLLTLEGLFVVQQALFVRRLDFKRLAFRSNVAALVAGLLGVGLALRGAGVWSLVAQQIATESVGLALLWGMADWRPRLRFSRAHARQLIRFSTGVVAADLGTFLGRRGDALFMGLFFGPIAVGLYRMADRLVDAVLDFTTRPVGVVSLPVLSRLQDDRPALRSAVASCFRVLLLITIPAMTVVALASGPLIEILGPEWAPAADVLSILAIAGIGQAVVILTGPVLYALARPALRAVLVWSLAALSTAGVVIVGVILDDAAVDEQVVGMAWARLVVYAVAFVPLSLVVLIRTTGIAGRTVLRAVVTPCLAALAAAALILGLRASDLASGLPAAVEAVVVAVVGSCGILAVLLLLEPAVRAFVAPYCKSLRLVRSGGGRARDA